MRSITEAFECSSDPPKSRAAAASVGAAAVGRPEARAGLALTSASLANSTILSLRDDRLSDPDVAVAHHGDRTDGQRDLAAVPITGCRRR